VYHSLTVSVTTQFPLPRSPSYDVSASTFLCGWHTGVYRADGIFWPAVLCCAVVTRKWASLRLVSIKKLNSMVWVRERTIPTERPPLVGEVIADFCGQRVTRGQHDGSLRTYSRFSRQEPLLFYQVAPQLYSRGWVDPVPDPLLFLLVLPGIEPGPPDL
jgi:hypothetical protein